MITPVMRCNDLTSLFQIFAASIAVLPLHSMDNLQDTLFPNNVPCNYEQSKCT